MAPKRWSKRLLIGTGVLPVPFALVAGVIERLATDGKAFILVSPETSSAGITEAALFKRFGGGRAVALGEPVGDRLIIGAHGGTPMVLPSSRIPLNVWVSKDDGASGCGDRWLCFWPTR